MTASHPISEAAAAPPIGHGGWTTRRLWTFRTGIALFAVQIAVSLFDASKATRAAAEQLSAAARAPFAAAFPGITAALESFAARSDAHAVVLGLARDALLALALAALWSLVDRRRRHDRLAGAVRVTLRYLVGTVMLVYGGFKVVPVQFPVPSPEALLRPLGEHTPMGLLWAFMGVSPAYTVFAGLGEAIGGALLFWRRTTTLGALLLVFVLANVVILNFAYDVPVKRGSALLLLAALVLAARDAGRLTRLLLLDLPTEPAREPAFAGGRIGRRVRAVLKPAIVALAILGPLAVAILVGPEHHAAGPLHGVYEVERFVRDGAEVPAARAAPARWQRLVLGDRGDAVVQTSDGRFARLGLAIDEPSHTVRLTDRSSKSEMLFRYERSADRLRLTGEGQSITELSLAPVPESKVFRVLH